MEFHRYWALKESYIKATGQGIGFGLPRLNFVSCSDLHGPYDLNRCGR